MFNNQDSCELFNCRNCSSSFCLGCGAEGEGGYHHTEYGNSKRSLERAIEYIENWALLNSLVGGTEKEVKDHV
jgi:hypothetical protein